MQLQRLHQKKEYHVCSFYVTSFIMWNFSGSDHRHEKYRTQYRAMFVMNCIVNKEDILRYKAPQKKQKRLRKKRRHDQTDTEPTSAQPGTTDSRLGGMDEDEIYHPVLCTECSTEVAVYDKDEVYHFFNILASHS